MSRVIHFEIEGNDPEKLAKFYTEAVGRQVEKWEGPSDYWLIFTSDREEEGIDDRLGKKSAVNENSLSFTISVPDCHNAVDRVLALGGKEVAPGTLSPAMVGRPTALIRMSISSV